MDAKEEITFLLRMPPEMNEAVRRFAQGDGRRPPSGVNASLIFLLGIALEEQMERERSAARGRHLTPA